MDNDIRTATSDDDTLSDVLDAEGDGEELTEDDPEGTLDSDSSDEDEL